MDSPRSEAVMTRFKGSPVGDGVTVGAGGRFVEVRGCGGHSHRSRRWRKEDGEKKVVVTYPGARVWLLYPLDSGCFVLKTQSRMI